jgi:hypothetical protein
MTKKDFFILAIKLFGLYSLVAALFSSIPGYISFVVMSPDVISILWIISAIAIIGGVFVLLVVKADNVVRLLKLDNGFDDDRIEAGNLKSTDVIKIGTFIIGGLLLINNIPTFLSHSFFAVKGEEIGTEYRMEDKLNWAISAINLIVGYLLLTNYNVVARILSEKTQGDTKNGG